jgi:phage protein U
MVLQIGSVVFSGNRGASVEGVDRKTEASIADKALLGGLPGREWTGWDGDLSVSGTVLPFHLGGLGDIDQLHGWCADGTPVPVIRGDGVFLGWYGIKSVREGHKDIGPTGVGFQASWDVALVRVPTPSGAAIDGLISSISSLVDRVLAVGTAAATVYRTLFG